jgi:hypothetical protein
VANNMQDDLRKMIERLLNQKRGPKRVGRPIKRKPRQIGTDVGPFPDPPKRPRPRPRPMPKPKPSPEGSKVQLSHDRCQEFLEVMVQNHARCQKHLVCQENQEREYSG